MTQQDKTLVIVGAGACGMVAALTAAENNISVLLLEKGATTAGNTRRSTGLVPAAGTRFQRAVGVLDDAPELMAQDIFLKNGFRSDPIITRILCQRSAALVEWLVDHVGCSLTCHTDILYPGMSRHRLHGPKHGYGEEFARQLESAVRANPRIELRLRSAVQGLLFDGIRVYGIRLGEETIEADAVILALDGFGGNREMVRLYLGEEIARALYFGAPENTGDGIRWGMELGAAVAHLDAYQGHASVAAPDGPLVTWALVLNGAIIVNERGERFGCETNGYSEFASDVMRQPGGIAWEIFDQEVYDASCGTRFEEVVRAGKVAQAASVEELAAATGLPVESLALTIEDINRATLDQVIDRFGRGPLRCGTLDPPFYWIEIRPALFHTQGGLVVDEQARVLRPDGQPIRGLYAGGGTAVGLSGPGAEGYLAGNGLLAAVGLGHIAGEAAARELQRSRGTW